MIYYDTFYKILLQQDRYASLQSISQVINDETLSIVELYENILTPFMIEVGNKVHKQELSIWNEHIYSALVQSIIENMYLHVYETKEESTMKSVMVVCPSEELHELGARMVTDFFVLLGYDVTYVGPNTPRQDIVLCIADIKPNYVAISTSSFYNLCLLSDIIDAIKQVDTHIKVIVGGNALSKNTHILDVIKADYFANSYLELKKIKEEALCLHSK